MKPLKHPKEVAQTQLDNRLAKARPVKLGWSTEEIEDITDALNTVLANYSVHYQKLRNYHWNVKGPDFFDLHTEFENQYNEAIQHIDDIAERIRIFGKSPLSTMHEYLEHSKIRETNTDLSSDLMVREVLGDYRVLLESMHEAVTIAAGYEDAGTEEMVKGFIHQLEKHHWMFSSFLAN